MPLAAESRSNGFGRNGTGTIVVTATRRELNIQEIPFNIATVSNDAIAKIGVSDLVDLFRIVLGLYAIDRGARRKSHRSAWS